MTNEEDLALETLLAVREEMTPTLSATLLQQCYAVQRKYQFLEDRTQATTAMERLIDEALEVAPTPAE